MSQPPYHLRPNKAVDRLTLSDAIKRVGVLSDLRDYRYYGLGGPYLEDFRLIYEMFPDIKMISIEKDDNTRKRQRFHIPCHSHRLKLEKGPLSSFLAEYQSTDEKSIFWLDYTGLEYGNFEDFMEVLAKQGANSILKITLRCNPRDYHDVKPGEQNQKFADFSKKFERILPPAFTIPPITMEGSAAVLQDMVRIASQKSLPSVAMKMFLPLASFYYKDGAGMFTLTGAVCFRSDEAVFRGAFKNWQFANLDWEPPTEINVPNLSTKERLHLQRYLPCSKHAGRRLRKSLGYLIDDSQSKTEQQLQQYADFHRYFPYFIKAVP